MIDIDKVKGILEITKQEIRTLLLKEDETTTLITEDGIIEVDGEVKITEQEWELLTDDSNT